jgi:hypothetical protein
MDGISTNCLLAHDGCMPLVADGDHCFEGWMTEKRASAANNSTRKGLDLERRTTSTLRNIVRALARMAARQHYEESCLETEKDSDSKP